MAHDIVFPRPARAFPLKQTTVPARGTIPGPQWLFRLMRHLRENHIMLSLMLSTFRTLQRAGINISPNHYYWPIPDVSTLEARTWPAETIPVGIDLRLENQLSLLASFTNDFRPEWRFPHISDGRGGYHYNNGFFETVDAEIAYSVVRRFKPHRIVEVGGGFSTRIMSAALRANQERDGRSGQIITIDPSPSRVNRENLVHVIAEPVQNVPLELFRSLKSGDILFLDSSHVVGVGSDVVHEYLEILPQLQPGVIVHVHDVFLPADYPRDSVLRNLCFWSEQYLLQAFLAFNSTFEVLWASSAMQIFHSSALDQAFPQWRESYKSIPQHIRRYIPTRDGDHVWPSSFWMRRTEG